MAKNVETTRAALARRGWLAAGVAFGLASSAALAQVVIPQANGSDGAFAPTESIEIPLDAAPNAPWDGVNPNPGAGVGVYDSTQWAVVYRFTSVDIPEGAVVTFRNHPSRAPVVWLVNGDVNIRGVVNLDGKPYQNGAMSQGAVEGGPGGFRGGLGDIDVQRRGSSGFGPGGGRNIEGFEYISAAHAGAGCRYVSDSTQPDPTSYGDARLIPLVGGSGGPGNPGLSGSGGGGAILIAATGEVVIDGNVTALGGNSDVFPVAGSGGSIRIVGDRVRGAGQMGAQGRIDCNGERSGDGFIRIDYKMSNSFVNSTGSTTSAPISGDPVIFPPASEALSVRITHVEGTAITADPHGNVDDGTDDYRARRVGPVSVTIETRNIPTSADSPTRGAVSLRSVPLSGLDTTVAATWISGDATLSTWRTTFDAATPHTVLQATASLVTLGIPRNPNAFSREVSVAGRTCVADLDDGSGTGHPDSGVTIDDLLYFLAEFADGTLNADLDDGTATGNPDGGVSIDDLLFMLERFTAGC